MFYRRNKKASSFAEYAIVFGIVTVALITMNTYFKRGIQGKAKDLTDVFISSEQAGKLVRKDVASISNTAYKTNSTATVSGLLGGEFKATNDQIDVVNATNDSEDWAGVQGSGDVVPSEAGISPVPVQPKPTVDPPSS